LGGGVQKNVTDSGEEIYSKGTPRVGGIRLKWTAVFLRVAFQNSTGQKIAVRLTGGGGGSLGGQ